MSYPADDMAYAPLDEYDFTVPQPGVAAGGAPADLDMFLDPHFWNMEPGPLAINDQSFSMLDFDPASSASRKASFPAQQPAPGVYGSGYSTSPTATKPASPATSVKPVAPTSQPSIETKAAKRPHSSGDALSPASPTTTAAPDAEPKEDDDLGVSAEEDKRRRNTAASARFRLKKKQREQAMEKKAGEMTERCNQLERQVSELEKENALLKGLLTEKAAGRDRNRGDSSEERSPKRVKAEAAR